MTDWTIDEINALFENAQKDETLFSKINVDELLNSFEKESQNYLDNKTFESISREIDEELMKMQNMSNETIAIFKSKLTEYMLIKEIHQFRKSHYVRFIHFESDLPVLDVGGILIDVDVNPKGVFLILKKFGKYNKKINMKDKVFFQKLKPFDKMILATFEQFK